MKQIKDQSDSTQQTLQTKLEQVNLDINVRDEEIKLHQTTIKKQQETHVAMEENLAEKNLAIDKITKDCDHECNEHHALKEKYEEVVGERRKQSD